MNNLDDEEDDGEGWLVSYADMMTLIACFFILMMAFASYEPVGFNIKAEELSQAFRKDKFKTSEKKFTEITEEVARHELKDRTKISMKDDELVIKFSSSILFSNASAEITPELQSTLDTLIDIIKIANPNYRILVEGHADDDLEKGEYSSQWALSADRAVNVAKRFEFFGFDKTRIVPIARGDSRLIDESSKKNGQHNEVNRRVVIRLLEPYQKKKVKFGLGVYFKDATEKVKEDVLENNEIEEFEVD